MKKLLFILLLFSFRSYGQSDTIRLREVSISADRSKYNSGLRDEKIDSSEIKRLNFLTLDQLLEDNSAINIKQYGNGQLSTVTLRGGSSYHTSVLWNGFQLNSPLHGNADLTLVDNLFFDQATILYGGASTLWGSGAVSGSIYLDNVPSFNSGLKITAGFSAGSFSDFTEAVSFSFGNAKYFGTAKLLNNHNKNDFGFYDENNDLNHQINSSIEHRSIYSEHYLRTGKFSTLSLKGWYSFYDRDIPPALQQVNSKANQVDKNLRFTVEWKYVKDSYRFNIRSAFFSEKETYNDNYLEQPSQNDCNSFVTEAIFEKQFLKKHSVQFGTSLTKFLVDSSANLPNVNLNRIAFYVLYKYESENKKMELSAGSRNELSDEKDSPLLFSIGGSYHPLKYLSLRTSLSKVFRFPTLNDLYWQPGGNNDLKPESGYSAEAGFRLTPNIARYHVSNKMWFDFTYYYRNMSEWIIWYPSGSSIWRPQNLQEVSSRGIETGLHFSHSGNSLTKKIEQLSAAVNYNYTISTNEKSVLENDESLGKQLIYVPLHSANFSITYLRNKLSLTSSCIFTGYRYVTSDNLEFLPDYFILNAEASYRFALKNSELKFFVRGNNLTDTNYQSVSNRPMPLRSLNTGINLTFIKQNKK
jgi:vitamin B12 transporter